MSGLRPCNYDDETSKLFYFARVAIRTGRRLRRQGKLAQAEEQFLAAREWVALARGEDLPPCGYCGNVGHQTRQCVHPVLERYEAECRDREAQVVLL